MATILKTSLTLDGEATSVFRLKVSGHSLDKHDERELAAQLSMVNSRSSDKKLVLDVCGVEHLGSDGVGILIAATHDFTQRGGRLALLVNSRQFKTIHMLGFDQVRIIPVFTSINEAVASLTGLDTG